MPAKPLLSSISTDMDDKPWSVDEIPQQSGFVLPTDTGDSVEPMEIQLPKDEKFLLTVMEKSQDLATETMDALDYTGSRLNHMAKSAMVNPQRMVHSSMGLLSLLWGLQFSLALCTQGWDIPHSTTTLACQGIVHTVTAALGATRLNFKNPCQACQNAQFWQA